MSLLIIGFLLLHFCTCSEVRGTRKCDPLVPNPNVNVSCYSGSYLNTSRKGLSSCSEAVEVGGTASYKCKQFYVPFKSKQDGTASELSLRCDQKGVWKGLNKFLNFRCKEDCGNAVGNVEPLVINGVATSRSLFPWHAMIFVRNGSAWAYLCGGSIIRNQVILTAAHCNVANWDKYRVILGGVSTNYSKNSIDAGSQIHSVQRIHVSESYDPNKGYQGDIAIFELNHAIQYTEYISSVCLPDDYAADVSILRNGEVGKIPGFDLTRNETLNENLLAVQLNVKSSSECYNSLHRVLTDSQFCAGSKGGKSHQTVCNGDSGSGMTFLSPVHDRFYVRGLVSTSDSDVRKGICQNLAVFTRIYPFLFWIRDVLEEISGKTVQELTQNVPYPFLLEGSEVQFEVFKGLPLEWENRVTRLELRYAYVQFSDILSSLEYSKTISSIHLSHIILDGFAAGNRRLVLPFLTECHLDILRPDYKLDSSRTFPTPLTEPFVKSNVFFDKDYSSRSWSIQTFLALKIDIDLVIHIFKLIHINATRGEIWLNQIGFSEKLFQDFHPKDFKLKSFALHRTRFNISKIGGASLLESLILSQVELIGDFELGPVLSKFPKLTHLLLHLATIPSGKVELTLDNIPNSLRFLSLSNSIRIVKKNLQNWFNPRFVFSDKEFIKTKQTAAPKNLKTFCCDMCELDLEVLTDFDKVFPNLSVLYLRTDHLIQISSLVQLSSLEFIHLANGHSRNLSNFGGLDEFCGTEMNFSEALLFRSKNSWRCKEASGTSNRWVKYHCSAGKYFWTSQEDYQSKIRLKSFEKEAFKSNKFVYHGESYPRDGRKVQFIGIPPEIQKNLRSIELRDVEVAIRTLSNSIEKCANLKSLTLLNTDVAGNGRRYSFPTENLTLVLDSFQFVGFKFEYVYEFVNDKLIAGVVPFQHVGKFKESAAMNTLSRLFKNITSARLEENSVTIYSFDSTVAEVEACTSHIRKLVERLPDSHPLKPTVENFKKIQNIYRHDILPREWVLRGFQILDQNLIQKFYMDPLARALGRIGVMQYFVKKFGKLISLSSLSLTDFEKLSKTFPPIQSIALSLLRDKISNDVETRL